MTYPEYKGLSYSQASNEGYQLVREATKSGNWIGIVERLIELKRIMNAQFDKVQ